MENRIDIFDIGIDALTAKDALKKIVQFMEGETLNAVEVVTLELLVRGQNDPEWREHMKKMDLILPGERDILDASEKAAALLEGATANPDSHLMKELDKRVFLKMFFKYLQRSQKKLFVLAGKEEDLALLNEAIRPYMRGMVQVGRAVLSEGNGRKDRIINEINGVEPDCILSILPYPMQERFISDAKALLNARVWMGLGLPLFEENHKKKTVRKLRRFFLKKTFLHLVDRQKEMQPAPVQSGRMRR